MSDSIPVISYRSEVIRKAIHLGALVLPLAILALPTGPVRIALTVLAVIALGLDVARQRVPAVRQLLVDRTFGWMMRPEELPAPDAPLVFNGAVWMCLAAAACAWLFPPDIGAATLAMLMIGDAAAALVGRRYGRTRWPGTPKSVEGSLAYALAALGTGLAVDAWPGADLGLGVCLAGAVSGAILEALPIPVNDNLRVPLLAGAAMVLVSSV
ncbi:MAG: diacylglycerol/polyprenol kinase family protein [Bacteroidota bacterium]